MSSKCKVCGTEDLLTAVTGKGVCSICTMKFFGGEKPTTDFVEKVREQLGLADGEFLKQDHGAEAARILGRRT